MKKLVLFILIAVATVGCQQRKKQIERLNAVRDSLSVEAAEKDSAIMEFLVGYNEIQENLDSIKKLEKLVTVTRSQHGELRGSQKNQILEDITLLNELLQKNKTLSADLQNKLKNANSRVNKLEGMVAEFERMVASLNTQIEMKDAEIAQLNESIRRLNIDVSQLTQRVEEVTADSRQKAQTIEAQTYELNKAFFAIGTVKELANNDVLEKSGGVLGIGRTLKMKKDFNRDYFTEIDIRQTQYFPLLVKKARIVTVHPETSFRVSGGKTADTLYIENVQEFWKASRYLLVVTD